MKSYTDIEQSKKLAEILPLESADMHYSTWTILDCEFIVSPNQGSTIEDLQEDYGNQIIPCWSLAALLGVLPNNEKETTTLSRGGWKIKPPEYIDNWWCEYEDESHTKDFTVSADDPIDACYEMILKLHELKML